MTGEGEGAEPPAAGTASFTETGADDRPLGVELGDRHMPASVVEFAIDLVGQQDDPIASCDSRQSSELLGAVRLACRVVRIVQDDEARPLGEPYRVSRRPHCLGGWGLWDVQVGCLRKCANVPSGWSRSTGRPTPQRGRCCSRWRRSSAARRRRGGRGCGRRSVMLGIGRA